MKLAPGPNCVVLLSALYHKCKIGANYADNYALNVKGVSQVSTDFCLCAEFHVVHARAP